MQIEAKIINRKQKFKEYIFWFIAVAPFFILILPATMTYLYQQWSIPGLVLAGLLLPISAVIYPFVIIIGKLGNLATIIFNFILVAIIFTLLTNAWTFTQEGHSIFHIRPRTRNIVMEILVRLKRFYGWAWLIWLEYLGYFVLYVLSPLYVLIGPIRQIVFIISLKSKVWAIDHPVFFSGLLFFFYLQVAIVIPGVAYQYLGNDKLFEGIVGAVAIITFVAFQFQRMTPPYFVPTFVDSNNTSFAKGTFRINTRPSTRTWLSISVTNLGITTFKNCVFQVIFPQGFSIIDNFDLYKDKDYAKHFTVRAANTTIEFLPRDNYMTFAPLSNLIFPICVLTPKDPSEYQIVTSLSSESAWAVHNQPLIIVVASE